MTSTVKLRAMGTLTHLWRFAIFTAIVAGCVSPVLADQMKAHGTWKSPSSGREGKWTATFDAAGADVIGVMSIDNLPATAGGKLAGTLDAGKIEFGIVYHAEETLTFTGSVTGRDLKGTFSSKDGVSGDWQGTLESAVALTPAQP